MEVGGIDHLLPHTMCHLHGVYCPLCGITVDVYDVSLCNIRFEVAVTIGIMKQTRRLLRDVRHRQHPTIVVLAEQVRSSPRQ